MSKNNYIEDWSLVLFLILILLGLILFLSFAMMALIDEGTKKEVGIQEVKCYDNFNNEIKGVACKEEKFCSKWGLYFYDKCGEEDE